MKGGIDEQTNNGRGYPYRDDCRRRTGADNKPEVEKCYGVAKAEKNDCAAKDGSHSCAHLAKRDNDPATWVYVPKGLCEKLAGGIKG